MSIISFPNIYFDPASNTVRLTLIGQVMEAKVLQGALRASKFALPVLVGQLLQPLKQELSARWDRVDAEEDIASIEADEAVVHEVMAVAFWWATSDYNRMENVRLLHFNELVRLANDCLKLRAEKSTSALALILGAGVVTLPDGGTIKVGHMVVESVSAA